MDGRHRVVGEDALDEALAGADARRARPGPHARDDRHPRPAPARAARAATRWVVNVARGGHIVTDDLVAVLAEGRIGGAALDVTDPEPLPDGHPLWTEPRCIITPHTANTLEMADPAAAASGCARTSAAGSPASRSSGPVDPAAGY